LHYIASHIYQKDKKCKKHNRYSRIEVYKQEETIYFPLPLCKKTSHLIRSRTPKTQAP
jgi:hypothetical protein